MLTYSLSQLTTVISQGFRQMFGGFQFAVQAEITRVKPYGSRRYLHLAEFGDDQQVVAKAKAIIFDQIVIDTFAQATGIKDLNELVGHQCLIQGKLMFHAEYGFSIIVTHLSSEFWIGQQVQHQQTLLQQLQLENIAHLNRQLPRPVYIKYIAIISGSGSEGLRDTLTILQSSQFGFDIDIYHSAIHGNQAAGEVTQALHHIQTNLQSGKPIDVVMIVRGGGESTGFSRQQDPVLVRTVCTFAIPVVVAIGHTADQSILDQVCSLGAKTPSDAAYQIIAHNTIAQQQLTNSYQDIQKSIQHWISHTHQELSKTYQQIQQLIHQKKTSIKSDLQHRYELISAYHPSHLTQKGYALIQDDHGNFLSPQDIESVKKGSILSLSVYGYQRTVQSIDTPSQTSSQSKH